MKYHDKNIYIENGYKDRQDYLQSLAEKFGISFDIVALYASILGSSEDFDQLITSLENEFSQK